MFLQPLKHNARKDFFFFPSATHTAPAISITAMWSQREQYICQQDQVLNRPREPLNPSRHPLHWPQQKPQNPSTWPSQPNSFRISSYFLLGGHFRHLSKLSKLPEAQHVTDTEANSVPVLQNLTHKHVSKPDDKAFIVENIRLY